MTPAAARTKLSSAKGAIRTPRDKTAKPMVVEVVGGGVRVSGVHRITKLGAGGSFKLAGSGSVKVVHSGAATSEGTSVDVAHAEVPRGPSQRKAAVDAFELTLANEGFDVGDRLDATRLGSQAARELIAQCRWANLVGDTLDTGQVRELLEVTRQALEARRRNGSLLGLASSRSGTRYPAWQFDIEHKRVRPEIAALVARFRDEAENITEAAIISWASSDQADLDGEIPAQWLSAGKDIDRFLTAATRAAASLAQ